METLIEIIELGRLTSIKAATLRKYVAGRRIPFVKVGRLVRFRPSEIEEWIACRAVAEIKGEAGERAEKAKGPSLFL
ncbi:MAG: helix-turn-helix domain-containing protein [Treponema sp.]|jgi:excisionase family DNA binding protein|nr:helix-turn-helix domain-containing protein [Treponema sp.]